MARETLNKPHEILAVAEFVRSNSKYPMSYKVMRKSVDGYDVYLPSPLDELSALYGAWLLEHPSPYVKLHFTHADISPPED